MYEMKGTVMMRIKVVLECTECHQRNYVTSKNKQAHPERLEVRKYCPKLRRYTTHRETR
jgi:large subunit ribosomal protein L33